MERVRLVVVASCVLLVGMAAGVARSQDPAPFTPRWVAGDLHIHTPYSHDSWGPEDDNTGPDEAYLAGNNVERHFAIARARGLDYLAISDHNDIRSQSDPGFATHGVIGVPAYEKSLRGHAQMLGATQIYDPGTGAAGVNAMADLLRARGGVFQINHPAGDSLHWPDDPDWRYGYDVVPDTVEVWNITPLWQPPAPSGNDQEGAIEYWEGWLDRGYAVGVTGGSDNHYVSTTAIQGAGQPTTWVWVERPGLEGILDGLRAGRTFVSSQPPAYAGVRAFLEADADGDDRYEASVGDTVPAGADVRVRTENAPPGSKVRLVEGMADGRRRVRDCIAGLPGIHRCTIDLGDPTFEPDWIRAEVVIDDAREQRAGACDEPLGHETTYCRNRLGILGMTSAIRFERFP